MAYQTVGSRDYFTPMFAVSLFSWDLAPELYESSVATEGGRDGKDSLMHFRPLPPPSPPGEVHTGEKKNSLPQFAGPSTPEYGIL